MRMYKHTIPQLLPRYAESPRNRIRRIRRRCFYVDEYKWLMW
jgi:hypothetical protein